MRPTTLAAIAMAACLVAGLARAQDSSPEALAAGRELIEASRAAEQFKMLLPLIARQLKPAIVQGRPEVERDYDQVMPLMVELAQRQLAKVTDDMAAIYARNFSVEDMRQITAFYRSPVGQAFLERFPAVALAESRCRPEIWRKSHQGDAADPDRRVAQARSQDLTR